MYSKNTGKLTPVKATVKVSSNHEIISVYGDGNCAFYAFAIGLMENIISGRLQLNQDQHASFLHVFGKELLDQEEKTDPTQVMAWVKKNYPNRYKLEIYKKFNPILRIVTTELIREDWPNVVNKMMDDLFAMVAQAREEKSHGVNIRDFEAIFNASYLKEGRFGLYLRSFISTLKHSIGTSDWQNAIRQWLNNNNNRNHYLGSVIDTIWASKRIELPLLAKYFSVSVYVDDERIYQGTGQGEIGLVMPGGTHYDYQVRNAVGKSSEAKQTDTKKNKGTIAGSADKSTSPPRVFKRLKKNTADNSQLMNDDELEDHKAAEEQSDKKDKTTTLKNQAVVKSKKRKAIKIDEDEEDSYKPASRGEKLVKKVRKEKSLEENSSEEKPLATTLKRTVQVRRAVLTEEKDSIYHSVLGEYDQQSKKFYFADVRENKPEFFAAIKSAAKLTNKCGFCRMSEREFEAVQNKKKHKKNTYIFIEEEPLEASKLYYVDANGEYELVSIQDFEIFSEALTEILGDKKTTSIDPEEVERLVTSNGEHTPSKLFRLRSEAIRNIVIDGCDEEEKAISGAHAAYLAHLSKNSETQQQYWNEFEKHLCQHPAVMDFIAESTSLPQSDSLQDKFNDVLSRNRVALYAFIAIVPHLKYQFNEYRKKLAKGFDWDKITKNDSVINEYVDYLQTKATGWLPVELHMFALFFEVRIALYVEFYDVPVFVETYGSGALSEIQLNKLGNFQRLEKTPELSFQTILKGKPSNQKSSEIIDPIRMIEKLNAMLSVLGNRPIYEQGVVDNALAIIKNRDTPPAQKLIIARLLRRMGYLVHGNLNPVGKTFKPEKICVFNFEMPFMDLKASLKDIISKIDKDDYEAFGKRNKLIANIAFNLTFIHNKVKSRIVVYLPIYIPGSEAQDQAGHHSEHALYSGLLEGGIFESILNQLAEEVARTTQYDVSTIRIYKVNAVVLQMLSRFRSCDDCHNEGLNFLRGDKVLASLQKQLALMDIKIPSKTNIGLAVAIQFCFDFSPFTNESKNLYTRALHYSEHKGERGNFLAHGWFIQRQTRKLVDKPDAIREYTLFLSKGSYNLVSQLLNRPARIQAICNNIFPLSEEQEDLSEALKEWEDTGEFEELEEEDKCGFCDYEGIRKQYLIRNVYNGNSLWTGSVCITGFQDIRFFDEDDLPVQSADARLTRVKFDEKVVDIKTMLAKLSDKKINFLKFYERKGYFTPSQAVQLAEIMRKKGIKNRPKIKIKEENDDSFDKLSNEDLTKINKWCNVQQKIKVEKIKAQRDPKNKQDLSAKKTKKKGAAEKVPVLSKVHKQLLALNRNIESSTQSQYTTTEEPSSPSDNGSTSRSAIPFLSPSNKRKSNPYPLGKCSSSSSPTSSSASFFSTPKKAKSENLQLFTSPKCNDFRRRIASCMKSNDKSNLIPLVNEIKALWIQANPEVVLSEIKPPSNQAERQSYLTKAKELIRAARDSKNNEMLGDVICYILLVLESAPTLDETAKFVLALLSSATRLLENKPIPASQPAVPDVSSSSSLPSQSLRNLFL